MSITIVLSKHDIVTFVGQSYAIRVADNLVL